MTNRKPKRFILVGPKGKLAGRKDQAQIALQIYCDELNSGGLGGGISTLLLPKTTVQRKNIEKLLGRGYTVKEVRVRRHDRVNVRKAVTDELFARLAVRFAAEKGHSKRAMSAVVREFSNWISNKLSDPKPNEIILLVAKAHPELPNRKSAEWWKQQIAQRKK